MSASILNHDVRDSEEGVYVQLYLLVQVLGEEKQGRCDSYIHHLAWASSYSFTQYCLCTHDRKASYCIKLTCMARTNSVCIRVYAVRHSPPLFTLGNIILLYIITTNYVTCNYLTSLSSLCLVHTLLSVTFSNSKPSDIDTICA